jgi:uncharacterized protein YbjT (DUF2867 family)
MQTILGAGGAIAGSLIQELVKKGGPIRVVSRRPRLVPGIAEAVPADVTDLSQTIKAVAGSSVVYLVVGLKYRTPIMAGGLAEDHVQCYRGLQKKRLAAGLF